MPVTLEDVNETARRRIEAARSAFAPTNEKFADRIGLAATTIGSQTSGKYPVSQNTRIALYNETGIDVYPSLHEIENYALQLKYRRWRDAMYFLCGALVILLGAQYHFDVPIGFNVGHNLMIVAYMAFTFFWGPLLQDLVAQTYLKERKVREMFTHQTK